MNRYTALASAVLGSGMILLAPLVSAAGGGGGAGGGMPSQSVPQYDVAEEFRKGVEALEAQRYPDADRAFGRVLRVNPRDANSNYLAGLAKTGLDKTKDASRLYAKAVKYDDGLIPAHQELGVALAKLGETDKARAVLEDLERRAAACAETCAQAADLRAAVSALEAALGGAPTSRIAPASQPPIASIDSGDRAYLQAVALINEKRYEQAIAALDASARVFGPHPDVLTYLGFAHRKLGRYAQAEDYYRQALRAAPRHLGATEYYGELMVERGDLVGARGMLAKLEDACRFGCAEADELRRWIAAAQPDAS
jgi:tetratricopeptide (TPR) repeat protein